MGEVSGYVESLEEPEASAGDGMPALRYRDSPLPDEVVDRLVNRRRDEIDAMRS